MTTTGKRVGRGFCFWGGGSWPPGTKKCEPDGAEGRRPTYNGGGEWPKNSSATSASSRRAAGTDARCHLPHYAASLSEVKGAKEDVDRYFGTLTKQARDQAMLAGVELETLVRQGHEVEKIITVAREGQFSLLIIGYHGHSGIFGRMMGSTAQSIVRLSPCPVLLAK